MKYKSPSLPKTIDQCSIVPYGSHMLIKLNKNLKVSSSVTLATYGEHRCTNIPVITECAIGEY